MIWSFKNNLYNRQMGNRNTNGGKRKKLIRC